MVRSTTNHITSKKKKKTTFRKKKFFRMDQFQEQEFTFIFDEKEEIADDLYSNQTKKKKNVENRTFHLKKSSKPKTNSSVSKKLLESIFEQLQSVEKSNIEEKQKQFLELHFPKKFQRFGHVLVIREMEKNLFTLSKFIAKSFISVFKEIKVVVLYEEGIKGELRKPTTKILWPEESKTTTTNQSDRYFFQFFFFFFQFFLF